MIESQAITECISVFSDIPVSLNMDVSLLHKGGVNHQQKLVLMKATFLGQCVSYSDDLSPTMFSKFCTLNGGR